MMVDPVKYKRILIKLLKLLVVIELMTALSDGISGKQWGRFGFDLIVAGILYVTWDRITNVVKQTREEARRKVEASTGKIRLWDALIFSLLWTDQIFSEIPADRKQLVVVSYTLITLGLVAAFLKIGVGLMPLVVSGALVLAAVNLLSWVVSLERGEKETLQTELKLAHDVQISLMPKQQPALPGYDIAGISIPAKEVGGDHFDYACLGSDGGVFGLSIFDVSGKGMEAAMSAVFTSGAYASEAKQSTSTAEILTRMNSAVVTHSRRGHFVAFLLAALHVKSRTLTFSNAGQMKPLLKSSGLVGWLDGTGVCFPLGMKEGTRYGEKSVQLKPGDTLFLLTDGFSEAMNSRKEQYGTEKLELLAFHLDTARLSSQQLLEAVTTELRTHIAEAPQHDDMTMVVVKVL